MNIVSIELYFSDATLAEIKQLVHENYPNSPDGLRSWLEIGAYVAAGQRLYEWKAEHKEQA